MMEAWVANLNGSQMHRVGYVEGYDGDLKDLEWSPDGDKLSFLHEGALYVVPAD